MEGVSGSRCEVQVSGSTFLSVVWFDFEFSALGCVIQYSPMTDCTHESLGIRDIF